jgi:hypothetical protein
MLFFGLLDFFLPLSCLFWKIGKQRLIETDGMGKFGSKFT